MYFLYMRGDVLYNGMSELLLYLESLIELFAFIADLASVFLENMSCVILSGERGDSDCDL